MAWSVGAKISAGFGLGLAILVVVGVSSYRTTGQLIEAVEWRDHTYEVLQHLDATFSLLQDVEIGERGFALTTDESYLEPYLTALSRLDTPIREVRRLTADNARQQHRLDLLEPLVNGLLAQTRESIAAMREKGSAAGVEMIKTGRGKAAMDEIRKLVSDLQGEELSLLQERGEAARQDAGAARRTIVAGIVVACLVKLAAAVLITRNIAVPLREMSLVAERIAAGDLSTAVRAEQRADEVGRLLRAFGQMTAFLRRMSDAAERIAAGDLRSTVEPQSPNDVLGSAFARMSETLRAQLGRLGESANVLGAAAAEIVAATTQLAAGASEAAAAVSQTTTTVEEVRQTAELASQKARVVSDGAQQAAQSAVSGRKSTEDMAAAMTRIRQQMEVIAEGMVRLTEQSQAIGQIIATVEDIAVQSTLLAVNAGIEAAKAGEFGRGFSVVAQEVKSLAEQSRAATTQVRTLLGDIQQATTAAMMATEQGSKAVEAGVRQTETAAEAIRQLAGNSTGAAQSATQIAASSQQQLVGMEQVAGAMDNIKQASAQNVASSRQLESSARDLQELGRQLTLIVKRYQL